MSAHNFKHHSITRVGFDYQELIGIEMLIGFFRNPDQYLWMELESENPDVGSLDDIVVAHTDGSFELVQVKFTVDPTEYQLNWDWLLAKKPKGTSLIKKWSESLKRVSSLGKVQSAKLRTNRIPDETFGKSLENSYVRYDLIDSDTKKLIESELGSAEGAVKFFKTFQFMHSERHIDTLEDNLKAQLVPKETDIKGWLWLRHQVSRWATRKHYPHPDGRIIHQHLVQIVTKKRPEPIPQDFKIPSVYCTPSEKFHNAFSERILKSDNPITVLWGTPGRGKSTYLSYLIKELRGMDIPAIRHHYFLSLEDTTSDRHSFHEIATSLMDQMLVRYPEAVKGLEESSSTLRKWIEACGKHFLTEGKVFSIFIDGLDHVWRENATLEQLGHLFNYLLPCPPNVKLTIGTQRVPDEQLPFRLIQQAKKSDWVEIPPMDEGAVLNWIKGQDQAGRIIFSQHKDVAEELNLIGEAFFKISHGHPLHLVYSFEALIRRGAVFSIEEIYQLPECPDGDIQKYYSSLWGRLSAKARAIIHLISGSNFNWPEIGIRQCIEDINAIDEIDHLLEHRRSGLIPFHGSILAFAKEREDHRPCFEALLPKIIEWLEREANDYLKWGWLWLMQAKNGSYENLLNQTTRNWAIESLISGRPINQILAILDEAECKAFEDNDYSRTIEIRSLKIRILNGAEYQIDKFLYFSEAAIRWSEDTQQILWMADGIKTLDENEVALLAKVTNPKTQDILTECSEELRERIKIWIELRHKPGHDFIKITERFFEVLSKTPEIEVNKILYFIRGFNDPYSVFESLIVSLLHERRLDVLINLAKKLKSIKLQKCLYLTQDAIVKVASLNEEIFTSLYNPQKSLTSPLMACWLYYHKAPFEGYIGVPEIPKCISKNETFYGRNIELEVFLVDTFFYTLGDFIWQRDSQLIIPTEQLQDKLKWISTAINFLKETARKISSGELELKFSAIYSAAETIKPMDRVSPSETIYHIYSSLKFALYKIAINLLFLKTPIGKPPRIDINELNMARSSEHWNEERWIYEQVNNKFNILDLNASHQTLKSEIGELDAHVTVFNERAEKWIELIHFAFLYQFPEVEIEELLRRAANCIIGYGWRKDLSLLDVLDAIEAVHEYEGADIYPWLKILVPIIEQVTEFTDGDETDHIRSRLIDLISKISPNHLPDFYSHYIETDELKYATHALHAGCKIMDFSNPISQALARTLVERQDIIVLCDEEKNEDNPAKAVASEQINFLGGLPNNREKNYSRDDDSQKKVVDVTKYGCTEFSRLLEESSDHSIGYENQRAALSEWLQYWKEKGKGLDALKSIQELFNSGQRTYGADYVLDDAFLTSLELEGKKKAYSWLVQAHIHRHGWQKYYASEKEILRRLNWAAKNYKDRWRDYIKDTSKFPDRWEKRGRNFIIGTDYLVDFLKLVGEEKLAIKITDTLVKIAVEEVSDQPIPGCVWFH